MNRIVKALALAAVLASGGAAAQSWPAKPIRVIIPFTAGSGTDVVFRSMSEQLAKQLGQPVVVENRTGAGGTIGSGLVAKADPDGYTFLVNSSSHTVNPSTYPNLPYDTLKDFASVIPLASLPNVLVISPAKNVRTVRDLVAQAKAKPGSLNYASAGAGSATHLNIEKFRLGAGIDGQHIPFKGTPEAMTEVMTGRVDIYFAPVVAAINNIREGKLVALAVGTAKRSSVLPDVPTTIEAGVPNSDYNFWVGMFAPAKTPRDIVNRMHAESARVLASVEVSERLAKLGAEPFPLTPEAFDKYVADEIKSNEALVRAANIKVQ
jgi:tripartite-type tricarboxylate transporter receptor subunit TctC